MVRSKGNSYEVFGKKLVCPICDNDTFQTRETLMNTGGMALFNLEFANKSADNFICDKCGYVYWFMDVSS